jgi:nitrogen fixation/metabolism regulation signal transduction histidine kinase
MERKFVRKPIANFFIKKDLQLRLIVKIVSAVLLATAIFAGTMIITYHFTYSNDAFYQVTLNDNEPQIGDRLNIVSIILPSLIISSVVNIVLAFIVGLYASRKYAVPIFKLEQWANLVNEGHITAKLRFREKEEMNELSNTCNLLIENLRLKMMEIQTLVRTLQEKKVANDELRKIQTVLDTLQLNHDAIEVQTSIIRAVPRSTETE